MTSKHTRRASFHLLTAAALALTAVACSDDDPVGEAASHLCACEKVNEPGTDVAGCEAEVSAFLTDDADCVTCVNDHAGAANAQACSALSSSCASACGFGEN